MQISIKPLVAAVAALFFGLSVDGQALSKEAIVAGADRAFEKAAKTNAMPAPGCSVGVSLNGESVFEKAFGLAEMEYSIPNNAQTIFESGSVAKQFTAAAVLLLAQDGKLSLDDPARKYVPELPEYEKPITIRHLLNHTAGLRDWGSVMALTGAGRGDRVITQDIALDVISRQKSLNFSPGAEYSYSNSGYNLAAIIVERVSKQKFADFVAERIFKPLGMKSSSIRDDYQRLVPGRAQAYSKSETGWRLEMPIMNVYGNGGVLTTVGDWLRWNAMLDSRSMGATLVDGLETQGVLADGRKIDYALGLFNGSYKGLKEIWHDGGTAGYQTFLARYPERKVSIAVLCNGPTPNGSELAHSIADELFGPFPAPPAAPSGGVTLSPDELKKHAGPYRVEKSHALARFTFDNGTLRFSGVPLRAVEPGVFMLGTQKITFTYDEKGMPVSARAVAASGDVTTLLAEKDWIPAAADLAPFAGDWYSDEAEARFAVIAEGDKLFLTQRPKTKLPMQPLFKDHFTSAGQNVWFTRDKAGKIEKMHIGTPRMRDMPFDRNYK